MTRANSDDAHDAAIIGALSRFVPEVLRVTGTPGLNVALARRGRMLWEGAFGYANVERRTPMTPDSVTRGGSMTKLYTAVAAMQLVERDVFDLYSPARSLIPDVRLLNPLGEREITIYDLLTCRSGLVFDCFEGSLTRPRPLADYVRHSLSHDARHEYQSDRSRWGAKVGERYQYSNLALAALGYIVERANPDGLSYAEYVLRHVIEPLGMHSTLVPPALDADHVPAEVLERLSTGYARFGSSLVRSPMIQGAAYPALGLLTTPSDQLRLVLALAKGGRHAGARILSPESVRLMLTPQAQVDQPTLVGAPPMWVGLVVESYDLGAPEYSFGHEGIHVWGWWNDCRVHPGEDIAFAVGANSWDMMRWYSDRDRSATGLVGQFIRDSYAAAAQRAEERQSWSWKRSYVAGLLMAERCRGLVGTEPLSDELVRELLAGSDAIDGRLDHAGFKAGVAAMNGLEMSAEPIRAFVASSRFPLSRGELRLLTLEFGRKGVLPVPTPFWANEAGIPAFASEEDIGTAALSLHPVRRAAVAT